MRFAFLLGAGVIALAVAAVPSGAEAQALPPGSWQQTCALTAIDSAKGLMSARCGTGQDGPGDDIEEDLRIENFWNVDFQYSDCGGPIDNRWGHLSCPIDTGKVAARLKAEQQAGADAKQAADAAAAVQYQLDAADQVNAATPGIRAAAVMILGRDLGNDDIRKLVMTARAPANPESRQAIFAKEFDFAAASTFLKKYIARSGGEPYRNAAVDAAFLQVYGRLSTPGEQVDWYNRIGAGKAWYASIVGDLMPSIAPGQPVRAGMAQRVATAGFGRDPAAAEIADWTSSGQNFGTMVEGTRQYLWSSTHVDELVQTVGRALAKLGRPTDDAAVKAAIAAWRPMRATYSDMVGPVGKAKLGNGRPGSPIRS